jgi:phospholipid/cholesterol/gamma-HCH transport system substrate-binding protein
MEPKQNYLLVGLFVLAVMVGIIGFTLWLADMSKEGDFHTYQTFVNESVNGLTVGSAVKYRGVDVGKVTVIDIPRKNPNKVRIVMQVVQDTPITNETVAVLQMQGITGIAYMELRGSTVDGQPIALKGKNKIPVIPSAPSEFRQIVDTVPDMLEKFTELADKLGQFASPENQERFKTILTNTESFSKTVGAKNANGETMIEELRRAVDEVRLAAKNVKEIAQASRGDTRHLLESSTTTIEKISRLADDASGLSKQGYQELQELLIEVKKTARDLQSLSQGLKDNPTQIIYPKQEGGVIVPKG